MWNREDLQRLSAGPRSLWRARQLKMITVRRFCHAHALPIALVVLAAVGTVIHAILPKIRGRIREVNPSAAGGRPAGRDNTRTFVLSLSFALTLSYFLFFSYSLPPLLFLDDTLNLVESLVFLTSTLSRSLSLSLSLAHTHTNTPTRSVSLAHSLS